MKLESLQKQIKNRNEYYDNPFFGNDSDDDDSIFKFETKKKKNSNKGAVVAGAAVGVAAIGATAIAVNHHQSQSSQNPTDIFNKINSGLKQAGKTKSRALGIQPTESDGTNEHSQAEDSARHARDEALLKQVQSSQSETSEAADDHQEPMPAPEDPEDLKKKRISFVAEAENTVHTYVAAVESSSVDDTLGDDDEVTQSSVSLSEKIGDLPQRSGQANGQFPPNYADNDDNDTYGDSTIGDSIGDSTYKSGVSNDDRQKDDDLNFIDHVGLGLGAVAATLGGLFGGGGGADNQANGGEKNGVTKDRSNSVGGDDVGIRSVCTEDEKSAYTEGEGDDTDTYGGESTAISTNHLREQPSAENDWLGFIGNMIFPKDQVSFLFDYTVFFCCS